MIDEEELEGIHSFSKKWDESQSRQKKKEMYRLKKQSSGNLHHLVTMEESDFSAEQYFAARLIQAQIRGRLMSKEKARQKAVKQREGALLSTGT